MTYQSNQPYKNQTNVPGTLSHGMSEDAELEVCERELSLKDETSRDQEMFLYRTCSSSRLTLIKALKHG